ncbi:MAG: TetR/AcrR family transcriptional regulator, partial [Myxococcota bacterium]
DARMVQVANALFAAAAEDDALATEMRAWLADFVSRLEKVLAGDYPDADGATVTAVAAGVTGIYFNIESLYALGEVNALAAASKSAALLLIETLETSQ